MESFTSSISSSKRCLEGVAVDVVEEACLMVSFCQCIIDVYCSIAHTIGTLLVVDVMTCLNKPLLVVSNAVWAVIKAR